MSISKADFAAKKNNTDGSQFNVEQLGGKHFKDVVQHMAKEREYTASQMRVQTRTLLESEQNMKDITDQAKTTFDFINDVYKNSSSEKATATTAKFSQKKLDILISEIEKSTLLTIDEKKSALKQANSVKRHINYRQETDLSKSGYMMKTIKQQLPSIAGIVTGVLGNNVASMFIGNFVQGLVDNRREERNSMIESAEDYYKDSLINEIKANKEKQNVIDQDADELELVGDVIMETLKDSFSSLSDAEKEIMKDVVDNLELIKSYKIDPINAEDMANIMNEVQNSLISLIGGDKEDFNSLSDDNQLELLSSIFEELQQAKPEELLKTLGMIQTSIDEGGSDSSSLTRLRGLEGANETRQIQEDQTAIMEEIRDGVNKEGKKEKSSSWFKILSGLYFGLGIAIGFVEQKVKNLAAFVNGITKWLSKMSNVFKTTMNFIGSAGKYLSNSMRLIGTSIVDLFKTGLTKVINISKFSGIITEWFSKIFKNAKLIKFLGFGRFIGSWLQPLISLVDFFVGFSKTAGNWQDKMTGGLTQVVKGLSEMAVFLIKLGIKLLNLVFDFDAESLYKRFDKAVENVTNFFNNIFETILHPLDSLKKIPEFMEKWVKDMVDSVKSYLPEWVQKRIPERSSKQAEEKKGSENPSNDNKSTAVAKNSNDAVKKLMDQGWSAEQAAGIAGNLAVESNFDPAAVGDGGKAYGIAQWHKTRQDDFKEYTGKDIKGSSVDEQLDFLNYELTKGKEQNAGKEIKNTSSIDEAAIATDKYYERSSGQHRQRRIDEARSMGGVATLDELSTDGMVASHLTNAVNAKKDANDLDKEKNMGGNGQVFAPVSNSSVVSNTSSNSNHFSPGTARDQTFARDQFRNY